ncbi:MAG: cytochrome P450 [Gemmatimonadota bacterium]|jgi:hypothetical protein
MLGWLRRRADSGGPRESAVEAWAFDPADPAYVADPYPFLEWLREEEPVHRSPAGPWVLTRYDDVHAALEDRRLGNAPARHAVVNARNRQRYVCADVASNILPFLDAPAHGPPRRVIGRAFAEQLRSRPPDIERAARSILDRWSPGAAHDVVSDYASPLAVAVIAEVLGVPRGDSERLEAWSETFFYLFNAIPSHEVRERLDEALTGFRAYMKELVRERRMDPEDDLLSALVHAREDDELTEGQLIDNCMLLFADGLENVDRAIGNAVYALLRHPAQLRALRARPELSSRAVDECLRYDSPAQHIARIALEDVEIGDAVIPAGNPVLIHLGGANRDPRAFEAPNALEIRRDPNPHLAFGRARHSCLGGPLVELQMRIALECLLDRVDRMELAVDEVAYVPRPGHRWVEAVPVRWME